LTGEQFITIAELLVVRLACDVCEEVFELAVDG